RRMPCACFILFISSASTRPPPPDIHSLSLHDALPIYRTVAAGMLLMVIGLVLFARLGLHAHYASLLPGFMLFGAGAGLMNVPLTNAVMAATPTSVAGVASALLNASREVAGLLGITVIGAVLRTAQGASARGGADPVHAFLDGYHTGLFVTIGLMAAGVAVSYLTLR